MAKPRYFEHKSQPVPPTIALCDRCRVDLAYTKPNSRAECHGCSEDEPGIPYIRLGLLVKFFGVPMLTAALTGLGLPAEALEAMIARAQEFEAKNAH